MTFAWTVLLAGCSDRGPGARPTQPGSPPDDTTETSAPDVLPPRLGEALVAEVQGLLLGALPDLDGDGADDLVTRVTQRVAGDPALYDPVDLWALALWPDTLAAAPPRFLGATVYRADDKSGTDMGLTEAAPAGDLDGDGAPDLLLTGLDNRTYLVPGPFLTNETDTLARAAGALPPSAPLGRVDADGDGADDLVAAPFDRVVVCPGPYPDLTLESCPARALPGWGSARPVAHADLDGDGAEEIVVADAAGASGWIEAFSADDPAGPAYFIAAGGGPLAWLVDVNGDGVLDLVWAPIATQTASLVVKFGPLPRGGGWGAGSADATVVLDDPQPFGNPAGMRGVLRAPSRPAPSILVATPSSPTRYWLLEVPGPGVYTEDDATEIGAGENLNVVVADVDADGVQDVVTWTYLEPDAVRVYSGADIR